MKTTKKTKRAKVDRRPYAHAADMREALLALHAVIKELGEDGHLAHFSPVLLPGEGVTGFSPSVLMVQSWAMSDYAERLRAAAKRMLVAEVGIRNARRYDGWRKEVRS